MQRSAPRVLLRVQPVGAAVLRAPRPDVDQRCKHVLLSRLRNDCRMSEALELAAHCCERVAHSGVGHLPGRLQLALQRAQLVEAFCLAWRGCSILRSKHLGSAPRALQIAIRILQAHQLLL